MGSCWRTQRRPFYRSFSIWSKWERWRSLISGCLMSWLQIKKIVLLKCCLLLFYTITMHHFSTGLWCAKKSGLYATSSDDELSGWTKRKLQSTCQSQTCNNKQKGHGHCLVICCQSDPLQLSESKQNHYIWLLSKSMRCTENCNPCSQYGSPERAQFSSLTTPECTSHNRCFKSWTNWATKFCLSAIFTWPLANRLPLQASQWLFVGKMLPQPARGRKCFPRVCWIQRHRFLHYRNKQTYF